MGIVVNKKDNDTELNQRITADLRRRAAAAEADEIDLVEDSDYAAPLRKTSRFGWVWIVLIALAILSIVSIVAF